MHIKFVDADNNLFELEECKYEIKSKVERLHNQIIPLKYFREIDSYCASLGEIINFESIHDNTITCRVSKK